MMPLILLALWLMDFKWSIQRPTTTGASEARGAWFQNQQDCLRWAWHDSWNHVTVEREYSYYNVRDCLLWVLWEDSEDVFKDKRIVCCQSTVSGASRMALGLTLSMYMVADHISSQLAVRQSHDSLESWVNIRLLTPMKHKVSYPYLTQ